jgi:hypothetical protein
MAWAGQIAKRAVEATISRLEQLKDHLLSGDDSNLESVWEEVCVQVQGEASSYWGNYEDVIDRCVESFLAACPPAEIVALWLSEENALDWLEDHKDDDMNISDVPVVLQDIVTAIRGGVLSAASDFESSRVRRYLERAEG